jgi:glucokinase
MAAKSVSTINPDARALAIDLGGTQIRAALIDRQGHIHRRASEPTKANTGPDAVIGQIAALAAKVCEDLHRQDIIGAGISSPGPLDTYKGVALSVPTLAGFQNYPLREKLADALEMTVALENDGIAAAIGEWQYGAGKGFANIVYVTVSTGIGGGIIVDNHVLRGRQGMAGHVGHMSIMHAGELCCCGNRGCFEAYASGTALAQRAARAAAADGKTALGKHGHPIDAAAVFAAAENGDALAKALVDEEADFLGQGFVSLLHLYSPDMLIIGGGISNQFSVLRSRIETAIHQYAMPSFREVPVVRAGLGDNSGIMGAASLVFATLSGS